MKKISITLAIIFGVLFLQAQEDYKDKKSNIKVYRGGETYHVRTFAHKFKTDKPKNVILMIGDGMGVTQVFAGINANNGHLFLENFKSTGFSLTHSADNFITDSAAGGTAIATGVKTYNGAVGVDMDTLAVKTILERAEKKGLATGLVSSSAITHATPASFIAHQPSRNFYEAIAADFLKTEIDVFIGGGYKHFAKRKDGRDLTKELKEKGYQVLHDIEKIKKVSSGKLAGLTAAEHNGMVEDRGNLLPLATETAIKILDNDDDGFFLMVEGSQIDWAGHQGNIIYSVEEMLDFDKAIGKALKFAAKDGETLIVVTSDHETGGLSIIGGDVKNGSLFGNFGTGGHTAVMVPVFAYGPGAENFTGIMDNTDINHKIKKLLLKE